MKLDSQESVKLGSALRLTDSCKLSLIISSHFLCTRRHPSRQDAENTWALTLKDKNADKDKGKEKGKGQGKGKERGKGKGKRKHKHKHKQKEKEKEEKKEK